MEVADRLYFSRPTKTMRNAEALECPTCAGWWWCVPDPSCGWHQRYPDGVFVEIEELDGCTLDSDRFCVSLTGTYDVVGLTREYTSDLFGKWFGPIFPPIS